MPFFNFLVFFFDKTIVSYFCFLYLCNVQEEKVETKVEALEDKT